MDWSRASKELVQEVVREAELYLQAQLSLALSADQRSSVMASLFTAGASAIAAGLMTLASSDHSGVNALAIYAGGITAIVLLVVAASFCIWSAWPTDFSVPGNIPASWYEDVEKPRDLPLLLGEQAEIYETQIADNNQKLHANARRFQWGALAGIVAPMLGLAVWLVVLICVPKR